MQYGNSFDEEVKKENGLILGTSVKYSIRDSKCSRIGRGSKTTYSSNNISYKKLGLIANAWGLIFEGKPYKHVYVFIREVSLELLSLNLRSQQIVQFGQAYIVFQTNVSGKLV